VVKSNLQRCAPVLNVNSRTMNPTIAFFTGPTVKEYGCKEVEVLMPDGRAIAFGQVVS